MDSLQDRVSCVESAAVLAQFRRDFHQCLTARGDELFELADAVLCADGTVRTLAGLSLAAVHQRGHGAVYDAVNCGEIAAGRLRRSLTGRRQKPRPAGRRPYGRGEPTPGDRPRFPGPVVARRYAPTGTGTARKAAVDREGPCSPRAAVGCQRGARRVSGGRLGAAAKRGQR
jgi:hypothetical protein